MRTFFIYPNLRKQSAREILPSVCERLRGRDIRLILPNQMRGTMHALHDEVMALDYMETSEAVRLADAAVVLGGVSLQGGKGSVWGTVIGVLFYGVLSAGFTSLHMSQYLQWVVMGAIMLFALSLDVLKGKGVKLWKRK